MKVQTDQLLKVLAAIRPGLANRPIVEQTVHFIFTGDEILTYNDKICIIHPFHTNFQGSVSSDELYKIVAKVGQDQIEFDYDEKTLFISAGKMKAGLLYQSGEDILKLVKVLDLPIPEWFSLPTDFLQALGLCLFSTSKDSSQNVLSQISVKGDLVVSSDNMRISRYQMQGEVQHSFLLPFKTVEELLKFDVENYFVGDSWIYFGTKDGVIFCSRVRKDQYPEVDPLFEVDGIRVKLPSKLRQIVDEVSVLAEGDSVFDKKIDVEIVDGKIRCKGAKEVGWIEIEESIKFKKESGLRFSINPIFFSQVLEKTTTVICGEDRALFWSGSFKHLVLLRM
jgi:DNA polymerase III sliding clamp (beta) subunit (PCNA family)